MTGCSLSMLPLHNLDFSQLYSPNLQFDDFTFPGSLTLPLTQNVVLCTYSLTLILNTVHTYNIFCIAAFSTVAERYCKAPTTRVQGPLAFEHCSGRERQA